MKFKTTWRLNLLFPLNVAAVCVGTWLVVGVLVPDATASQIWTVIGGVLIVHFGLGAKWTVERTTTRTVAKRNVR